MPGRHILHIDANAFYASVEMQETPALRGKRIAVCGSKEDRHGIVLTASYPAKRMGVKTGMAIWQAQRCCRDLLIVPPHYREYMRYSGYMREILQDYTDQIEAFGLDESWADVSGSVGLFGSAMTMAQEISDRVKRELGITVSIGVSNNKVTAKLGSDYKKPDAITRIEADNYQEIVYPLPVQDLLYVGPATQRKLNSYGIRTIGQLAETSPETLRGWFGKVGYSLSAFARGLDASPVARQDHVAAVKSVGNSGTTPRDLVNNEDVWLMLLVMAESVAMRMRELNMKCTVVEVSVRDCDLNGFVRQRKIDTPTSSSLEIAQIAFELFKTTTAGASRCGVSACAGPRWYLPMCPFNLAFSATPKNAKNSNGWTRRWMSCASGTATPASSGRGSIPTAGWGLSTPRMTTQCIRWDFSTRDNVNGEVLATWRARSSDAKSGMWKWMSALSRTATCGRWPSALDRSRCTRSTRSKTSAAAPQRWAVWGTGMSA